MKANDKEKTRTGTKRTKPPSAVTLASRTPGKPEAAPVAKRSQGRPRAEETLGRFAWEGLLWPFFANWLTKKREAPKGLPTRTELWNAVPDKKRYFTSLARSAFCKPGFGGATRFLEEAYTTSPDLTCEALLFLRARAREHKKRGHHSIVIYDLPPNDNERKISAAERDLRRRHREAVTDFVARTAV